jgi:membrane fusion protein (multidrug efflux system)
MRNSLLSSGGLAIMILGILIFTSGCSKEEVKGPPPPPEVKVTKVESRDIPVSNEWIGQTFGAEDVEIRSRVEGYIEGIFFAEGTNVGKGTLLYTIDTKELEQKLIEAQGRLKEAETMLVQAENDVKRFKPLADAGAVSIQRYEIAFATFEARKGNVEAAQAAVRIAEINLGYSRVTAPISGVIGITQYRVGDYVSKTQNSLLNTISNIDPIRVRFNISEQEYLSFRRNAIEESTKGNRRTLNAKVEMILSDGTLYPDEGRVNVADRQVDPSTGTLMLEALFPNPQQLLRPGQYSKIRSVTKILTSAVVIPTRAISELQGQFQVFVVGSDSKAVLKTIKKGPQYGQFTVIESGLSPGETVIVEGIQKVRADMVVATQEYQLPKDTTQSGN